MVGREGQEGGEGEGKRGKECEEFGEEFYDDEDRRGGWKWERERRKEVGQELEDGEE